MGPVLRPQGCVSFGNRFSRSSILLDPELCGMWWDEELGAALTHPCDETAVAVLLGTPKLSPPPCFLAREISAPTGP
eukprot:scaffold10944_cov41-Phaeocystis_antarctica.AAC.1